MATKRTGKRTVTVLATAVAATLSTPWAAHAESGVTVIASGLDNPRGLAFAPNGSLFVAEAGLGGPGPCFPGPEGEDVCFGATGAITQVKHGVQRRVVTGLPSIAAPGGGGAIGPSDVAFRGGTAYFTVGLGADPAVRENILPALGQEASGWVVRDHSRDWKQVADIAGFEAAENPDLGHLDSNPNSLAATHRGFMVADAGGNSVVFTQLDGRVSLVTTFPEQLVDAPPFLGLPPGSKMPAESVPTSVVRGPDGAFYVGELTGFPFQKGAARVWRLRPGHDPEVFASGFTNIIDIGFAGRTLYVLEIAHNGLLSGDPTGALIRVDRDGGKHLVMSDGLIMPGGLALFGGAAYVSNCGVCPGGGEVLRIPLGA